MADRARAVPESRGDPGERHAAVAADPIVRRERQRLDDYLAGTYRDPRQAAATIRELIARDGDASGPILRHSASCAEGRGCLPAPPHGPSAPALPV